MADATLDGMQQADLIRRLREYPTFFLNGAAWMMSANKCQITNDAADVIERLQRENAELRHDLDRAMANHNADLNG